jgi:type IV secretory pathway VirB10-like protein
VTSCRQHTLALSHECSLCVSNKQSPTPNGVAVAPPDDDGALRIDVRDWEPPPLPSPPPPSFPPPPPPPPGDDVALRIDVRDWEGAEEFKTDAKDDNEAVAKVEVEEASASASGLAAAEEETYSTRDEQSRRCHAALRTCTSSREKF